jgi:hypothetical protein
MPGRRKHTSRGQLEDKNSAQDALAPAPAAEPAATTLKRLQRALDSVENKNGDTNAELCEAIRNTNTQSRRRRSTAPATAAATECSSSVESHACEVAELDTDPQSSTSTSAQDMLQRALVKAEKASKDASRAADQVLQLTSRVNQLKQECDALRRESRAHQALPLTSRRSSGGSSPESAGRDPGMALALGLAGVRRGPSCRRVFGPANALPEISTGSRAGLFHEQEKWSPKCEVSRDATAAELSLLSLHGDPRSVEERSVALRSTESISETLHIWAVACAVHLRAASNPPSCTPNCARAQRISSPHTSEAPSRVSRSHQQCSDSGQPASPPSLAQPLFAHLRWRV